MAAATPWRYFTALLAKKRLEPKAARRRAGKLAAMLLPQAAAAATATAAAAAAAAAAGQGEGGERAATAT